MDEKGPSETLGMEDAGEVADRPRKAVTYAGRVSESSRIGEGVHKPSVLGRLKEAQKKISGEVNGRKKPKRKQEQQL